MERFLQYRLFLWIGFIAGAALCVLFAAVGIAAWASLSAMVFLFSGYALLCAAVYYRQYSWRKVALFQIFRHWRHQWDTSARRRRIHKVD